MTFFPTEPGWGLRVFRNNCLESACDPALSWDGGPRDDEGTGAGLSPLPLAPPIAVDDGVALTAGTAYELPGPP